MIVSKPHIPIGAARKTVREIVTKDWWELYRRGYAYHVRVYAPALRALESLAAGRQDLELAADGYSTIGELNWLCLSAYRAALDAFYRATKLDPRHAYAWDDAGMLLYEFGEYRRAKAAWQRAMRLFSETGQSAVWAETYLARVDEDITQGERGNLLPFEEWNVVAEFLAKLNPRAVLRFVRARRGIEARQYRARAYAALGDVEAVLGEWAAIARSKGEVSMHQADWFLFPDEVWDSSEFWKIMMTIGQRFAYGYYPVDDDVTKLIATPRKARWDSKSSIRRQNRQFLLMTRLRIARLTKDRDRAWALACKYPGWKAAVELAATLSG